MGLALGRREYQLIYHTNFGPPLLEEGARLVAPVASVMPFNAFAASEMAAADWQACRTARPNPNPNPDPDPNPNPNPNPNQASSTCARRATS